MSAIDTAKEIVRIGTTAGLSKDVIDLQAAKLDILVKENAELSTKVSRLEIENSQLRGQLKNTQPVMDGFHEFAGVLWKRTANGFETFPYCNECVHHPIMSPMPPHGLSIHPMHWECSARHRAPYSNPPSNPPVT
jgi:hypothetical protein